MACQKGHSAIQRIMLGGQRHKSPHAAYAKGYLDGVQAYYEDR